MCKILSTERVLVTCSLCGGFQLEKKKDEQRKNFAYFKKKSQSKDETKGIQITNVLTSVREKVTSAEFAYAEEEMQKTYERQIKYQVEIPARIKKEVDLCAKDFGTASAFKKFTTKYPKYSFSRTTVNTWKKKCNDGDWTVIKRIGKPNLLDSGMLKKVKDIALGTRMPEGVINKRQLISIATGVVRANNPNLLKEQCRLCWLCWARVLEKVTWSKRRGTTGKVAPHPDFSRRKVDFSEKHTRIGF